VLVPLLLKATEFAKYFSDAYMYVCTYTYVCSLYMCFLLCIFLYEEKRYTLRLFYLLKEPIFISLS